MKSAFSVVLILLLNAPALAEDLFEIQIVDSQSERGIPLVELKTVNNVRFVSDSGGFIAINDPDLMNQKVFFHVFSHGYEYPKDGFGYRGKRLAVTPGGRVKLELKRINIAERLYRVTGGGIYRDSVLLDKPIPIEHPLLNAQVFGSDSVVNAIYRGKIYWFWGDTNRPAYPLGNFHVPGATSRLPAPRGDGLDPELGVKLDYFVGADRFAKPTAALPGKGPTWINGLVTVRDPAGEEQLFATYVKIKSPMIVYQRGLVRFDDEKKVFEKVAQFDLDAPLFPGGHPVLHSDNGTDFVYFARPYPTVRVRATADAIRDLSQFETYTYLKQGSGADSLEIDRDTNGKTVCGWKSNTIPLSPKIENQLIKKGVIKPEEALMRTRDIESDDPIALHGGSVYWNQFRKRWIMIAVESYGTSHLGEVWFAESQSLTGPWSLARKIVTHEKYSFYNPKQHPMFDSQAGRFIFFEGTYTNMFSGNPDRTPRYNYNQIMYKLDLADPRLKLETTKPK